MSPVLVISPHLDDAVLSASGLLRGLVERGSVVEVLTLFAGIPEAPYSAPAVFMHELWGLAENPMERRRDEDRRAHQHLGTRVQHADFLDEVYRKAPNGDWLVGNDWQRAQDDGGDEQTLRAELAAYVYRLITDRRPCLVLTCAGVGRHVDHRRTRDAVLTAAAFTEVAVRFWEDLPYAEWTPEFPPCPEWAALAPPTVEPVDEQAWATKMSAVQCYASQHQMLWPEDGQDFRVEMDKHAKNVGREFRGGCRAERYWDVVIDPSRVPAGVSPTSWCLPLTREIDPDRYALIVRPSVRDSVSG